MSHPDLDRALSAELANAASAAPEVLREWRHLLSTVEEQMSYVRRVAQSRTDMVRSELTERTAGHARSDLSDIIRRLPQLLSESVTSGGDAGVSAPDIEVDPRFCDDLDAVVSPVRLLNIGTFSRTELRELVVRLEAIEARISVQRRLVQDRMDAVEAEIMRRDDASILG